MYLQQDLILIGTVNADIGWFPHRWSETQSPSSTGCLGWALTVQADTYFIQISTGNKGPTCSTKLLTCFCDGVPIIHN